MKILWVLVNYHADDEIVCFVNKMGAIFKNDKVKLDFIVVDNSLSISDKEINVDLSVKVINPKSNLGYLPAFCLAVDYYARENNGYADYCVLSNSDLKIPEGFNRFFDIQNKYDYDVFSPQVKTSDDVMSNPIQKIRPTHFKILLQYLSSYKIAYFIKNKIKPRIRTKANSKSYVSSQVTEDNNSVQSCYSVHGSFISLSKKFFTSGAKLSNYKTFLFCEEFLISEEANSLGLKVGFTDDIIIIHDEHKYISKIPREQNLIWYRDSLMSIYYSYYWRNK